MYHYCLFFSFYISFLFLSIGGLVFCFFSFLWLVGCLVAWKLIFFWWELYYDMVWR